MRSIGMVFGIYVSNKIGSEAVGTFDLVMSVYMLAITIATSGLNIACISIVSEQFAKKDFLNGLTVVKTCIIFAILLGVSSSIILFLFSDFIIKNWLNNIISSIPLYLIALGLPFIAISSVSRHFFLFGDSAESLRSTFYRSWRNWRVIQNRVRNRFRK